MPLSMRIMAQNGRFLFWRMAIKMPNSPNLIPSKISRYTVYTCIVYTSLSVVKGKQCYPLHIQPQGVTEARPPSLVAQGTT